MKAPKLLLLGIAALAFSVSVRAADATATASATIITPMSISKTADMNFGYLSVGASAGTVVLAPAGTRTYTGGVTLLSGGTVTAAAFTVTGSGSMTYSITLPTSVTLTSSGNTMTANTFTSTPSGTGTLSSGSQALEVGATLNVGANQAAGAYTSSNFTVTVAYN
jgi:hypothetical protein